MPTNTMKAIRLHEFGGPEVLHYEDVFAPERKPGGALVRVHADSINPPDWYLRDRYKCFLLSGGHRCPFPSLWGRTGRASSRVATDVVVGVKGR